MSGQRSRALIRWSPLVAGLLIVPALGARLYAANQANDVYEGGEAAQPKRANVPADDKDKADTDLKRIEEKLDEILRAQETILAQYDEIMEGLQIAKVRVSR